MYVKKLKTEVHLIVSLYVDDLLVIGSDSCSLKQFKQDMENEFEMNDLGEMKYFLGMKIHQSNVEIFISQRKYALEILKKFYREKYKPVATPMVVNEKLSRSDNDSRINVFIYRSLIGSLLYLSSSKLGIMLLASLLSKFMQSPFQTHFGAAECVLKYIKGTSDCGLWFLKNESGKLQGYADSD